MQKINLKSNISFILICLALVLAGILVGSNFDDSISFYIRNSKIKLGDALTVLGILVSSIFAYYGFREARLNTINQNTPYIHILCETNPYENFFSVKIINSGTGAALDIKSTVLMCDDSIDLSCLVERLNKLVSGEKVFRFKSNTTVALSIGNSVELFRLNFTSPDTNNSEILKIKFLLSNLKLQVKYKNALDTNFEKTFKLRVSFNEIKS